MCVHVCACFFQNPILYKLNPKKREYEWGMYIHVQNNVSGQIFGQNKQWGVLISGVIMYIHKQGFLGLPNAFFRVPWFSVEYGAHRLVIKVIKLSGQAPGALSTERPGVGARPRGLILTEGFAEGLLSLPHQLIPPLVGHWNYIQHRRYVKQTEEVYV